MSNTLKYEENHIFYSGTASWNTTTCTADVKGKGNLRYYLNYNGNNITINLKVTHNWNTIDYWTINRGYYEINVTWQNVEISVWDTITITTNSWFNGQANWIYFSYYYLKDGNKKVILYDIKEIWEKVTAYLFGMLKDGTRRDGN